ncbi:MAG: potassium channel protein [Flavobacteriaceae bacterium]|nr:potassium channel protein [Flavobacteriaceae bacterium]
MNVFDFFRSKFIIAVGLLLGLLLLGVVGYRILGDYSWLDGLYMTIITVTTVGFREVGMVDDNIKIFTIILIICGIFIGAYAISVITEYIFTKNSLDHFKSRRTMNSIKKLENHIVICGFGRNGRQAAKKLEAYRRKFVVIEKEKEEVEKYQDKCLILEGNANDDEVLLQAGIERASCLITALPNDADNLFVVLSARQLNKKLYIISRASDESAQKKIKMAGANSTIMPDKIGGDHMASLVVVPDLIEFMDQLSVEGDNSINLEEISYNDIPEEFPHATLIELDLRRKTGCTVIGYKSPEGQYIVNPEGDMELKPNSKLMVLGRPEQIHKLNQLFKLEGVHVH